MLTLMMIEESYTNRPLIPNPCSTARAVPNASQPMLQHLLLRAVHFHVLGFE